MTDVKWLDEEESRLWRAFLDMRRHLDRAMEHQLTEIGLSMADYQLLVPLSEAEGQWLRARDLGRGAGWDRSRLSHHLRRMEQRGLIARVDCPSDARGTNIELTDAGRAAVEAAAPGHVDTVRRHFIDLLTRDEIGTLTGVAERVRDRLSTECDKVAATECDGA